MSDFVNTVELLGDKVVADSIVDRTITELADDTITKVAESAFRYAKSLRTVNFPNCTEIEDVAFESCSELTTVEVPEVTTCGARAFYDCVYLTSVNMPKVKTIETNTFRNCWKALKKLDFLELTSIKGASFYECNKLVAVIIRTESVCSLANVSAFTACYHYHGTTNANSNPDGLQDGYVYVPRALVESYKTATNWASLYASYANMFRALEDYTVDGTIYGELDESKI